MNKLSAPIAISVITVVITTALSLSLSFILSGEGATTAQKFEIFPLAFPFALIFTTIGILIVGMPALQLLKSRNLDQNFAVLVGCGAFGGCLYVLIITLAFAGEVPNTVNDLQFFFGLGGGLGALSGALWRLLARHDSRKKA